MSGSSALQDPVALGAAGSCHIQTQRYDGRMQFRRVGPLVVLALVVVGCGGSQGSASAVPTGTASLAPAVTAPAATGPSVTPATGQTDTDWGRIWDTLPASFPVYPGATPAEEAETGPVSATFALEGPDAKTIATWMQTELERAAFSTEALTGPFEDGSFVLESTGASGCRVEVAVAPLGGLTTVTVRYGAACPSP